MRMKKLLSLLLALVMVLSLVPATVFATEEDVVYISVSYDDKFTNDKNGNPIAFVPVSFEELAAIDLTTKTAKNGNANDETVNLSEYLYDEDGDGTYETTALHLIVYAHEKLYGGDFSEVTFTGNPGSTYFAGGLFGRDENLNYYLNGQYPLARSGWGATSDQIVLEAGDFINLAGFTSWDFYQDSGYGFHFFADENGDIVHSYTGEVGTALDVKLIKGTKDYEYNSVFFDVPDYTVHYGTALYEETGTVTTDGSACASITFPTAGTYYLWVDGGYGNEYSEAIVSAPGYATVTVTAAEEPEQPREPQDVSAVLNATMAQMAATVTEPVFGTTAGEWTVLSLARGSYYAKDNAYFTDYYSRIVNTVNEKAASVNLNGALHKNKSTENSRLIVALSALGKDATAVGDWDLVEAYSANGMNWINKQGLNGTIWALIALDSNNYETTDTTIRQACVDRILSMQHNDGGWALQANLAYASDPDVTGMALTALYPYRDQTAVAEACAEAIACLSTIQNDNGTYTSGGSECAESCAWVIVATTTWGINPDTDSRFIKNGNSVVDGLLAHYVEEEAMFQHIIGAGSNAMATDQSCYALVAYDRFINGKAALYDYSDVTFEEKAEVIVGKPKITLGLPKEVNNDVGTDFNAVISIDQWDNEGGWKLVDFIMTVPTGLKVTDVTAENLKNGKISFHAADDGKLRVVYFDADKNTDLTMKGGISFPAEMFTVTYEITDKLQEDAAVLPIAVTGMSIKLSSEEMIVVDVSAANGMLDVVEGVSYSAVCLYEGDDVDLIPSTKKAVAVAVAGLDKGAYPKLTFQYNTFETEMLYSAEITAKSGVQTYVALVDQNIPMVEFTKDDNFTLDEEKTDNAAAITFGEANGDGVVNAQDALAAVDAWLRKGDAPTDNGILTLNVNGDSRINTFDALGIMEHFVDNNDTYGVVTKAATITTENN